MLSPHLTFFSLLDYPGWVSPFHWVFSLDQFATAGKSSVVCNVFSLIPRLLDLLVSPGGQRLWPVHLWPSGLAQCPAPLKCSINNKLKKILDFQKKRPTISEEALQKLALSSLPDRSIFNSMTVYKPTWYILYLLIKEMQNDQKFIRWWEK